MIYKEERKYFGEMANLYNSVTGIMTGIIQIRPEERHVGFPHLHYCRNIKLVHSVFAKFTISENADEVLLVEIKGMVINSKELKNIKCFITKNSKALIDYYDRSDVIDTKVWIDSLVRI